MSDRPYNLRASRILEQSQSDGRNIRRSLVQPRSDENRITNRPYRGSHRAEYSLHGEHSSADRRSSRVGRHHAEPTGEHHLNNHY